MGALHLVGGEKGGVGKSFTARLLAQYLVDNYQPFIGFDSDSSHGTFSRFYSDFVSPVSVQDFDSLDAIIEAAEQNPSGNIIVDLAAQTAAPMYEWINSCDFLGLMAEFGVKVYLWHVMDDGADSMNLLTKVMDTFRGKNIKIIAVQNQGRGNNYKNFEESAVYTRAKTHGVEMLTLARLHDSLAQKIDFNNFSFWAAANSRDFMSVIDRRRVGVWLKHAYSQIEQGLAGSSSQQSSTPLAQARNGQTAPSVHSLQVQRVSEAEC